MSENQFNTAEKRQPLLKKKLTNDLKTTVTINEKAKITKKLYTMVKT